MRISLILAASVATSAVLSFGCSKSPNPNVPASQAVDPPAKVGGGPVGTAAAPSGVTPARLAELKALQPPEKSAFLRDITFDEARAKAGAEQKVVLVDFYTTWCVPCKQLDRLTWPDPNVVTWLRAKTVAIKVDAEKEADLAKRYKVDAYPTLAFIRPDGTLQGRAVGFFDPNAFLERAADALAGITPLARAREALQKDPNNPMKRMDLARCLAEDDQNAEALKELLACFDEGRAWPGFGGVRVSFLLADIVHLGQKHPPALAALRERRDRAAGELLAGRSVVASMMDVNGIDRALNDPEHLMGVFDKVIASDTEDMEAARGYMVEQLIEPLLQRKRYPDILKGQPQPLTRFDQARAQFKMITSQMKDRDGEMAEFARAQAVALGTGLYEALVGDLRTEEARILALAVLEFDPAQRTLEILKNRATHAGNTAEVEWLVQKSATLQLRAESQPSKPTSAAEPNAGAGEKP